MRLVVNENAVKAKASGALPPDHIGELSALKFKNIYEPAT